MVDVFLAQLHPWAQWSNNIRCVQVEGRHMQQRKQSPHMHTIINLLGGWGNQLGVAGNTCTFSTWEAEAEKLLKAQGQAAVH